MKPPTGGPITGPINAGVVTQAMARTKSRLLIERTSTMRPTGVIMAPPMPCTMRAITKPVSELDSAQPIEPTTKTRWPPGTRCGRQSGRGQPLAGMKIASDNK